MELLKFSLLLLAISFFLFLFFCFWGKPCWEFLSRGKNGIHRVIFQIWTENSEESATRKQVVEIATTKLEQDSFNFIWSIENFTPFPGLELRSPIFGGGPNANNKWYLSLSPKRGESGREVFVGLYLYFLGVGDEGGMEEIQTLFHLRITGENGLSKETGDYHTFKKNVGWGWAKLLTISPKTQLPLAESCPHLRIECSIRIYLCHTPVPILSTIHFEENETYGR